MLSLGKSQIVFILFWTTIFILGVVFCFAYFPQNDFIFGMRLAGENIGGLSEKEAEEKINTKINKFLEKEINFIFNNNETFLKEKIKMKDLGFSFELEKNLKELFKIGKIKLKDFKNFYKLISIVFLKIKVLKGEYNFPLKIEIKEENLDKFLGEKFSKFETFPKNAEIIFDEKKLDFEIKEEKEGYLFNKEKIKDKIKKEAQNLIVNDFYLLLEKTHPEIQFNQVKLAQKKAREILKAGPYLISINDKTFLIKENILGTWFSFLPQKENGVIYLSILLDENLIKDYLSEEQK